MNLLLLSGALLAGSGGPTQALPQPATHADSVAILHEIFRQTRRLGRFGTAAYGVNVAFGVAAIGNPEARYRTLGLISTSFSTAGAGYTLVNWVRYSQRREARAVQQLERGQPIPRYVQQRYVLACAQASLRPRRPK